MKLQLLLNKIRFLKINCVITWACHHTPTCTTLNTYNWLQPQIGFPVQTFFEVIDEKIYLFFILMDSILHSLVIWSVSSACCAAFTSGTTPCVHSVHGFSLSVNGKLKTKRKALQPSVKLLLQLLAQSSEELIQNLTMLVYQNAKYS